MEPELSGKEERFSLADAEWGKLPRPRRRETDTIVSAHRGLT